MLQRRVPLGLCPQDASSLRGRPLQRIAQPGVLGARTSRHFRRSLPTTPALQGPDGRDGPSDQELFRRPLSPGRTTPSGSIPSSSSSGPRPRSPTRIPAGPAFADTASRASIEDLERIYSYPVPPEPQVPIPPPLMDEDGRPALGRVSSVVSGDEGPLHNHMLTMPSSRPMPSAAVGEAEACSTSGAAPDVAAVNGHHAKGVLHANGYANGHAANGHAANGLANGHASVSANGHASSSIAVLDVSLLNATATSSSSSSSSSSSVSSLTSSSSSDASSLLASSAVAAVRTSLDVPAAVASEAMPSVSSPAPPNGSGEPSASSAAPTEEVTPAGFIPKPILVISFVSATLTMASCVFNTLLPIYMVTELKMSMRSMGMFEGLLEAFSYVVRMFSGVVSDMMTSRKAAITLGFAMGAMAKFGMSGAVTVGQLFASKAVDRLANGVQAAPRDALISDLAPASSRSACFGFAQGMRKWGSFMGAGLSYFLMKASGNNYKLIFLMAATVSVASCLAFVFLVPSHVRPTHAAPAAAAPQPATAGSASTMGAQPAVAPAPAPSKQAGFSLANFWRDVRSMGPDFYRMLAVIALYGMGHINESMLEARAMEVGFGKAESTLVVALLALMISIAAYPLGRLDDKFGPRVTFAVGMGALIAGNLTLLFSGAQPFAVFGACLFLGMHWAVIQGPLLSIVVGLAPSNLRGTAFGIFYTVMAVTAVAANSLYGSLWTACGAPVAFSVSATLMTGALVALPALLPRSVQGRGSAPAVPSPSAPKLAPA